MSKEIKLKTLILILFLVILVIFLIFKINFENSIPNDYTGQNKFKLDNNKSISYEDVIEIGNLSNCRFVANPDLIESCEIKLGVCSLGNDNCFYKKAVMENNESKCFNIENTTLAAVCNLVIIEKNIFRTAVLEKNISKCEKLSDQNRKTRCRDNYYLSLQKNEGNSSACNLITNEVLKHECIN